MDLNWKIRLVDRLINNNPDATIKHYLQIVDDDFPDIPEKARRNQFTTSRDENGKLAISYNQNSKSRYHEY